MCAICVAFEAGKLTRFEASKALIELITHNQIDEDHIYEVEYLVIGEDAEEGED